MHILSYWVLCFLLSLYPCHVLNISLSPELLLIRAILHAICCFDKLHSSYFAHHGTCPHGCCRRIQLAVANAHVLDQDKHWLRHLVESNAEVCTHKPGTTKGFAISKGTSSLHITKKSNHISPANQAREQLWKILSGCSNTSKDRVSHIVSSQVKWNNKSMAQS